MVTTLIVNGSPYGSELPYNALRLAGALLVKGHWVELFFLGDGVHTARRGQDPRGAHASLEECSLELLAKGAVVTLCGTCCQTRGLDCRRRRRRRRSSAPSTTSPTSSRAATGSSRSRPGRRATGGSGDGERRSAGARPRGRW